jgi:4-hydroxy-tetrahydrodipicolinate reductase
MGCQAASVILKRRNLELVGAVDTAHNVGYDIGDLIGSSKKTGIIISDNAGEILTRARPDIVLHMTSSSLLKVQSEINQIITSSINVVSSTEELSYPWRQQPIISAEINELAKKFNVTVLGTGINPGYVMDTWPLSLTAVCQKVKKVRVTRIQDASNRREPFQKKIGAGLTIKEFHAKVDERTLRHVGLTESIEMIAAGLGWELEDVRETIEPIIAEKEIKSEFAIIKPGQAMGVRQVGIGLRNSEEVIRLDFEASIGSEESYDAVYITGTPNLETVIKGGIHGDLATAAIVVNTIPHIVEAPPGLLTMKDIPLVTCSAAG